MKRYVSVDLLAMKKYNLTLEKWVLLENIDFVSKNQYQACTQSKKKLGEHIGVSERQIFNMITSLEESGFIQKNTLGHVFTTQKWAEISYCIGYEKNADTMQNLQGDYAEFAEEGMQNLQSPSMKKEYKREEIDIKKNKQKKDSDSTLNIVKTTIDHSLIHSFINHRKEIKKPMTQTALDLFIKKLESIRHTHDIEALVNDSIINGYQGIFPKDPGQSKQQPKRMDISALPDGVSLQSFLESIPDDGFLIEPAQKRIA